LSERIPAGGPFRAVIGLHEQLNAETIKEARKLWGIYCSEDVELCRRFSSIARKVSSQISLVRIEDIDPNEYKGLDRDFLTTIKKIIDRYSTYLSGEAISFGEFVLVKFNKDLMLSDSKEYERGEVTLVQLEEAVLLSALDYVEIIKTLSSNQLSLEKVKS